MILLKGLQRHFHISTLIYRTLYPLIQVDIVLGNLSATGQIARNGTAGGIIVQQGTLALHGMAVAVPWTHLVGDSLIGDTSFTAAEPVDWQVILNLARIQEYPEELEAEA